jgi:hypothetical protein
MTILLILAPFGAFAMLMLAAGSAILFTALGCYITMVDSNWTSMQVRIAVDVGTLAIALLSIAIRMPFTLQYAREAVDAETTRMPGFMAANYIITWAWTGAFVLMTLANILMIYMPSLPLWIGIGVGFAARNSAVYFTKWYPQHLRAKRQTPRIPATVMES